MLWKLGATAKPRLTGPRSQPVLCTCPWPQDVTQGAAKRGWGRVGVGGLGGKLPDKNQAGEKGKISAKLSADATEPDQVGLQLRSSWADASICWTLLQTGARVTREPHGRSGLSCRLHMIQREPGTDGLGSTASHLVISSRPTLCGIETQHRRRKVGQRMRSLQAPPPPPPRVYSQSRFSPVPPPGFR